MDARSRRGSTYAGPTITRQFGYVVSRYPDKIAVVDGRDRLTYRELDRRANSVARSLRARGVLRETRVAVALPRGADLYAVMLGVLKIGAIVVPLNTAHPPAYLADTVASAGAEHLVRGAELAGTTGGPLAEVRGPVSCCSPADLTPADAPEVDASDVEVPDLDGEATALILFTSGSTGRPKGVEIAHRGLARLATDGATLGVTADDCFVQLSEPSFAASTNEIWMSLLHGARLVVLASRWPSITELRSAVFDEGVTVMSLPSGLFSLLVDHAPDAVAHLRAVFVSGDFVSPDHLARAARTSTSTSVFNGYGCTENSSISALWRVPADTDFWGGDGAHGPVPIGTPLPSVTMEVRDEHLVPCPAGELGELCIGGAGVAKGYLGDPSGTAEKFVSVPDVIGPVVRTGDLARRTEDGDIVLVGRDDSVVKIRGFRVETSAVEMVLRAAPGVERAAVTVIGDPGTDRSLAGFYTVAAGQDLSVGGLRERLSARLPDYMLPSTLTMLDELPVNANGKIDRAALALVAGGPKRKGSAMDENRENTLENVIREMWKNIVKVDDVEPDDPFLSQGATSLNFVQFSSTLETVLDVNVSPEDVFRHGTVEKLARHIADKRATATSTA